MNRVLIIEDEALVARMYQKSLTNNGFEVEIAMGGEEGVNKIETFKPDLVLMDIMMPGMNGMDALKKIRAHDSAGNTPVVILSNLSGEQDAELAKSRGAVDYWVKKDTTPRDIVSKVNEILERKDTKQE